MSRGPGILVFLVAAVGALVGHGCGGGKDSKAMTEEHIDRAWFRRSLVEDNLAHWLAAAPAPNGFFRTTLDRQWRPAATQIRAARSVAGSNLEISELYISRFSQVYQKKYDRASVVPVTSASLTSADRPSF